MALVLRTIPAASGYTVLEVDLDGVRVFNLAVKDEDVARMALEDLDKVRDEIRRLLPKRGGGGE